jgi:hypothetical protein
LRDLGFEVAALLRVTKSFQRLASSNFDWSSLKREQRAETTEVLAP